MLFRSAASWKHGAYDNGFVVNYSTLDGGFLGDLIPTLRIPSSSNLFFFGLAATDQSLYVSNGMFNYVSEYSLTGTLVNEKLIDNIYSPFNIMASGSTLYIQQAYSSIGQYTTSGQTVNASLISGVGNIQNFTVVPVPEPSTCVMALAGLGFTGYSMFRRRKRA